MNGLGRTPAAPWRSASSIWARCTEAVMKMTGMPAVAGAAFSASPSWKPSRFGIDTSLNKFLFSKGVRSVPHRVRVRMSRKRNEDEEATEKVSQSSCNHLYTSTIELYARQELLALLITRNTSRARADVLRHSLAKLMMQTVTAELTNTDTDADTNTECCHVCRE